MHHSFLFAIIALFGSQLQLTIWLLSLSIERLNVRTPRCFAIISLSSSFLHSFTKTIQKAENIFICCAIPKKKAVQ